MYQIEKLEENKFYIKATGTFPPPVAEKFDSIEILLELLKENNKKLFRSAFIVGRNPPLSKEMKYILEKAASPKRKIVSNLEEAKE